MSFFISKNSFILLVKSGFSRSSSIFLRISGANDSVTFLHSSSKSNSRGGGPEVGCFVVDLFAGVSSFTMGGCVAGVEL